MHICHLIPFVFSEASLKLQHHRYFSQIYRYIVFKINLMAKQARKVFISCNEIRKIS